MTYYLYIWSDGKSFSSMNPPKEGDISEVKETKLRIFKITYLAAGPVYETGHGMESVPPGLDVREMYLSRDETELV